MPQSEDKKAPRYIRDIKGNESNDNRDSDTKFTFYELTKSIRGVRENPYRLLVIFEGGKQKSIPYHLLGDFDFDDSNLIEVEHPRYTLQIKGTNLQNILTHLNEHQVKIIKEGGTREKMTAKEGEATIDSIEVIKND